MHLAVIMFNQSITVFINSSNKEK